MGMISKKPMDMSGSRKIKQPGFNKQVRDPIFFSFVAHPVFEGGHEPGKSLTNHWSRTRQPLGSFNITMVEPSLRSGKKVYPWRNNAVNSPYLLMNTKAPNYCATDFLQYIPCTKSNVNST